MALDAVSSAEPNLPPPSSIVGNGDCSVLSMGAYNVENLTPDSSNLDGIADQIVNYMNAPALLFRARHGRGPRPSIPPGP